ncbi:hypothetical protein IMZ48_29215 [Candidatus Bathyarchaeota archaeon]|nr:hypothetical protein [Candidatus Bathyarchaeota archaeon]
MRYSAAESLKTALRTPAPLTEAYLPVHQALYTLLNDDDPDIRLLAAEASSPSPEIPLQAAQTLLSSLATLSSGELAAAAACRVTGHVFPVDDPRSCISSWTPSDVQLRDSLRLDTSLFVVEAQNLFVDPAREARRWGAVLASSADESVLGALAEWVAPGLKALAALESDGVLGWGSRSEVLVVVVRIVVCCGVLSGKGYPEVERGFSELGPDIVALL